MLNEDYKKNEFYESLVQLDRLISDLLDEDPEDDSVKDLDSYCQAIMEDYQLLYNGFPIAIDKELDWCNSSLGGVIHKDIINKDYEEGYVKGLKAAVDIFKQIRDQY